MSDKNIITGETKELTLVHLLESSKKHRIKEIAENYGIKLSDKSTKQQMITALLPAVEVQSGIRIKRYSRDDLQIIMNCLTEHELPAEKIAEVTQSAPFRDGIIYIAKKNESVFTYVPHELAGKSMMRCVTECADSQEDELQKCAAACAALYGSFSPELFCRAAQNGYGLKVSLSDAESFLASDNSGLSGYDNQIASADTSTQVRIREEAQELDYYLPTKKQADSYASFGADTSDYYYRQITNFLYNNTGISYDKARALMKKIAMRCAADDNPATIFEEVIQSGAVMTTDQYNFLLGMIGELFNRSRKHSLKGHLPEEVDGVMPVQIPSVQAVPAKPEPVRAAERIGRNDPCPCGSGKKYKKCCGKNL